MEFAHYKCFIIIIIIACNLKKGNVLGGPRAASRDSGRQHEKDVRMQ